MRLGTAFIALCMVAIAGSLGAVLYLSFGFARVEAAVVAIAALTGLALLHAMTTRVRDRSDVGDKIADLSRGTADLARQVADLGRRVAVVEAEIPGARDQARAAVEPLSAEIEMLGTLVRQVADSVAAHESVLVGLAGVGAARSGGAGSADARSAGVRAPGAADSAMTVDRAELGDPEPVAVEHGRFKGKAREEVVAVIRRALDDGRIDLYLQPIVTLPQRKVRYYEAVSRLRAEDGELLMPAEYLGYAETGGLMPRIDNLLLIRCVQVVRRLLAKNREIGLFCNIAGTSLADPEFSSELSQFMEANRAIASSLVFEFSQASVRAMGPLEHETLAGLADLGFRFSMDRLGDLRLEPRELAERGFRFVKVPAALLLNRTAAASDIHPADFSDLLGRYGVDLIAEKIESEGTVVDLLDFDVRFGQGFLFSPPRPVRTEALQAVPEPPGGTRRLSAEPEPARGPPGTAVPVAPEAAFPNPPSPGRRASGIAQLARGVVRRA